MSFNKDRPFVGFIGVDAKDINFIQDGMAYNASYKSLGEVDVDGNLIKKVKTPPPPPAGGEIAKVDIDVV
jgi:hypothetical protein